jgi:DNA-directed RNA polymerase specialized sigma24 family protein
LTVSTYVDGMASPTDVTTAAAADDPDTGLRAIRALRNLADRLEVLQVGNARARGWSWQQIADALGVSKQAVHKKHARGRKDD